MNKGNKTKTPVHTGQNAPKIGQDGLSNRARRLKNKQKNARKSFKHGQRNGKPRIPGNTSFDRSLAGKDISTANAISWKNAHTDPSGWPYPCPIVDALRKTALDLINGEREQERNAFLFFYPTEDLSWKAPMPSLAQPLRQLWPIVGFKPATIQVVDFNGQFVQKTKTVSPKLTPVQKAKIKAYKQFASS